ncbi:uncharacterized protein L199_004121 [Kwoniella botswanensis]|uniref:uncharacterized protein n=1 Tax=Kwoniella botswanensis TaxID=1268659 RepID=UPI00315DD60D
MGPKKTTGSAQCQICKAQISKYKCPACPVRYCSVACYKQHKLIHEDPSTKTPQPPSQTNDGTVQDPAPSNDHEIPQPFTSDIQSHGPAKEDDSLPFPKPLTSLLWPPEPDPSIFTDPLLKEDPKPLKREELLRIATSPSLRSLLSSNPLLPLLLKSLDSLPTKSRHIALSRLLNLDPESLSHAEGINQSFLSGRNSPPPLDELLCTLTNPHESNHIDTTTLDSSGSGSGGKGWYLNVPGETKKIWIGEEERKLMRLFAASVCTAIDGQQNEGGEVEWGQGRLEWEF